MVLSIDQIKKVTTPIFKKYNLSNVYLFGSYASGMADVNSDVDILFTPPSKFTLTMMSDLEDDLQKVLQKKVDLISENIYLKDMTSENSDEGVLAKEIFYEQVKNGRILLYG